MSNYRIKGTATHYDVVMDVDGAPWLFCIRRLAPSDAATLFLELRRIRWDARKPGVLVQRSDAADAFCLDLIGRYVDASAVRDKHQLSGAALLALLKDRPALRANVVAQIFLQHLLPEKLRRSVQLQGLAGAYRISPETLGFVAAAAAAKGSARG